MYELDAAAAVLAVCVFLVISTAAYLVLRAAAVAANDTVARGVFSRDPRHGFTGAL